MKSIKYIILGLFGLLFFISCNRELDINPEQSITTEKAVSTPENINNILIGAYANTGKSDLFGGNLQMYADLLGTQVICHGLGLILIFVLFIVRI